MSKTITLTFGEKDYVVPRLNIGQIEEITDLLSASDGISSSASASFKQATGILAIALRRADPQVSNIKELEADADDIKDAVTKIMRVAGLAKVGDRPAGELQANSAN